MAFSRWRAAMSRFARLRSPAFRNVPPLPMRHITLLQSRVSYRTILIFSGGGATALALSQLIERTPLEKTAKEVSSPAIQEPQPLDLKAATAKLQEVESILPATRVGDKETPEHHIVRFASNSPIEDDYVSTTASGPGGKKWYYWGVFDGHAGWATSTHLRKTLVPTVSAALSALPADSTSPAITASISTAFQDLDAAILTTAEHAVRTTPSVTSAALCALAPAIAGSCALLAMYDPTRSHLRVACVGDSRAVLGRYSSASGTYTAIPLSRDQTGFNALEVERIARAHPGERDLIDPASGRLLGIAITRAFGDSRWKWPEGLVRESQERFWGYAPRPGAVTPPYMSAEPVVAETAVEGVGGERGDFVVLASDGLWDHISSEDAVECVGRWVEARRRGKGKVADDPLRTDERVDAHDDGFTLDQGKYVEWRATPEHFVIEDENAATHLVKNAFGGSRRGLFCAVMSAYPPISRNVRDDVTVQVVFFGKVQAR